MKTLLIGSVLGYAALAAAGVTPCPCELIHGAMGTATCAAPAAACTDDVPSGVYVEARDATVWGGACHVSAQAETGGACAALGWSFEGGAWSGVSLAGVRAAAAVEGADNLSEHEAFHGGDAAARRALLWIDAPTDEAAEAAESYLRSSGVLGEVLVTERAAVSVSRSGDAFHLAVGDVLEVAGEARADRACCSMPESRWYSTLAETRESVVAVPDACRFDGLHGLGPWAFEEENSAYVARFGA